jgi:hypothetical protein
MAALKAGEANINVAGSGNATFASDGDVEANIMGSGHLVCEDGDDVGKTA